MIFCCFYDIRFEVAIHSILGNKTDLSRIQNFWPNGRKYSETYDCTKMECDHFLDGLLLLAMKGITVTSHERHGVSTRLLLRQIVQVDIKGYITGRLRRESAGLFPHKGPVM